MGFYKLGSEEIVESFEEWLQNLEGGCDAQTIAEAWNIIAEQEGWNDRLKAVIRNNRDD